MSKWDRIKVGKVGSISHLIRRRFCTSHSFTVHNNEPNNLPQSSHVRTVEKKTVNILRPSFEEVASWGKSFDGLMEHRFGRKLFAEFLKSEFSDENLLFWLAVEDLKQEKNVEEIEEKTRVIYEDFVSILSPKEVSLDSRVREIINGNMVHPSTHTFDEAQEQIYTLMHRDSYPRFITSIFYHRLLTSFGDCNEEEL